MQKCIANAKKNTDKKLNYQKSEMSPILKINVFVVIPE